METKVCTASLATRTDFVVWIKMPGKKSFECTVAHVLCRNFVTIKVSAGSK